MISWHDRRIWYCFFAVVIGILSVTRAIDDNGVRNTEDALVRALSTYAIARALNGVISVAQGTEIAIEPAGVGIIFTPGQILDPINDLVERFSWVMLVSSASLGVLNVLQTMSMWHWFNALLLIALGATMVLVWLQRAKAQATRRLMLRFVLVLVIVRFIAPMIAISNEFIYQQFLEPSYQTAISELEQTTGKIEDINEEIRQGDRESSIPEPSILDKARELYESARQSIDVKAQIDKYETAASNASRHAIDLIVIFIFQTILVPIIFLWLSLHLVKFAASYDHDKLFGNLNKFD